MDFAQRLVALSYESLGYFVIEGLTVGVREADILAVRLDSEGKIIDRLHVEVRVNAAPKGVIRSQARFGKSGKFPRESAIEFIKKKYEHPKVVAAISSLLGSNYRCVFVHGRLKDNSQLTVFEEKNIECIPIEKLVSDALKPDSHHRPVRELKRVADVLNILKP